MSLSAHLWTLAPRLRPCTALPEAQPWSRVIEDPRVGAVTLTGLLRHEPGSEALILFVHGIAGCADAAYARELAEAASRLGISCLRINMRGCDRLGGDYYHAGLAEDLGEALRSPELARYRKVFLVGYSMGGHLALRYAADGGISNFGDTPPPDPRLAAVAAVCSPLDLISSAQAIDLPLRWAYRRFVLRNLREIYAAVAASRPVPVPVEQAGRLARLRDWDEAVIAPRWGFAGAQDYYARASVAPHLGGLGVPVLLLAARNDPMVPSEVLAPAAERWRSVLDVRWIERGGHLGFPADLDLGFADAPPGLPGQVIGWLLDTAA